MTPIAQSRTTGTVSEILHVKSGLLKSDAPRNLNRLVSPRNTTPNSRNDPGGPGCPGGGGDLGGPGGPGGGGDPGGGVGRGGLSSPSPLHPIKIGVGNRQVSAAGGATLTSNGSVASRLGNSGARQEHHHH
nr:hypothetical protein Iba_chr10dCG5300 [Ipomoea batatas]